MIDIINKQKLAVDLASNYICVLNSNIEGGLDTQ